MRLSGHDLRRRSAGLTQSGVDVVDIRQVGTEQVYYATFALGLDGGVMVTASHNPADYNGMKFVREKAIPISGDTGLKDMERMVALALDGAALWPPPVPPTAPGTRSGGHLRGLRGAPAGVTWTSPVLTPMKIVANVGNGMAGPVLELLQKHLPFDLVTLYPNADGTFPHGVPNPLLPENREVTAAAVREVGADFGLAWDGDFDRCFFYDERAASSTATTWSACSRSRPCAVARRRIVHDPRLVWNTEELVRRRRAGARSSTRAATPSSRSGCGARTPPTAARCRRTTTSGSSPYCDSGMIPWLLVARTARGPARGCRSWWRRACARYPISGEINLELPRPDGRIAWSRTYGPKRSWVISTA